MLVGLAAGYALGAGYEFETPGPVRAEMIGGGLGPWAPGEHRLTKPSHRLRQTHTFAIRPWIARIERTTAFRAGRSGDMFQVVPAAFAEHG